MKILMVCLGNICRSPLAEGILRNKVKIAGLDWIIDSAGTSGHNPGCPPHRLSQKVALENGIDLSSIRCRNFTKSDINMCDKIYVMDEDNYAEVKRISGTAWDEHKVDYLLNEIFPGKNNIVMDPWYGGEEGFYEVYDLIDKACNAIIMKYGS